MGQLKGLEVASGGPAGKCRGGSILFLPERGTTSWSLSARKCLSGELGLGVAGLGVAVLGVAVLGVAVLFP